MEKAIRGDNLATRDDVVAVRSDIARLEQRMLTQMKDLELRLTIRLGGTALATAGIVVA